MKFASPLHIYGFIDKPTINPQVGTFFIYPKVNGKLYILDSAGTEFEFHSEFTISGDSGSLLLVGTKSINIKGQGATLVNIVNKDINIFTDAYTKSQTNVLIASTIKVHASVITIEQLYDEIPEPTEGMIAIVGDTIMRYQVNSWVDIYESYIKSNTLSNATQLSVFANSSQFFQIPSELYTVASSYQIRYLAKRGNKVKEGNLKILGNGIGNFYLTEDSQESLDMGLTINLMFSNPNHYVVFASNDSDANITTIKILQTLIDTITI